MRRRRLLASFATAGLAGVAGCSATRSDRTLSDPAVHAESDRRRSLAFAAGGEELASLGASARPMGRTVRLSLEFWHRAGTSVRSMRLRVWLPDGPAGGLAEVALVSPVEGDSSPPPAVALSSPRRAPGTAIEVGDFDDLADETITLDLLVVPRSAAATVAIDGRVDLRGGGWFGTDYALDGRLEVSVPDDTAAASGRRDGGT